MSLYDPVWAAANRRIDEIVEDRDRLAAELAASRAECERLRGERDALACLAIKSAKVNYGMGEDQAASAVALGIAAWSNPDHKERRDSLASLLSAALAPPAKEEPQP